MSHTVTAATGAREIVRAYVEAVLAGEPERAEQLTHPQIQYRALIANGAEIRHGNREALTVEWRDFFAYGRPEVLRQEIEQVGSYVRWSTCWRVTKDGQHSLFEWHAYLAVVEGLITRFDEICTGRVPEA